MMTATLQGIAEAVVRRARDQGSVSADEVRQELTRAGVTDETFHEVLTLCRRSLRRRQGRYHFVAGSGRTKDPQSNLRRVLRDVIRRHKQEQRVERRGQDRIDFIQPVRVTTEDGRELHLLSRDLSPTGIRLIGTRSLLGQKVRVRLGEEAGDYRLAVRVLWTCSVGDQLFENGGMFLDGDGRN